MKRSIFGDTLAQPRKRAFRPPVEQEAAKEEEAEIEETEIEETEIEAQIEETEIEASDYINPYTPSIHRSLLENESSVGLQIMKKMGFRVGQKLGKPENSGDGSIHRPSHPILAHLAPPPSLKPRPKQTSQLKMSVMKVCFDISGDADVWDDHRNLAEINYLWREYPQMLLTKEEDHQDRRRRIEARKHTDVFKTPLDHEEHVDLLLRYLRKMHRYCYFCGCGFETEAELEKNCPGISQEDHET